MFLNIVTRHLTKRTGNGGQRNLPAYALRPLFSTNISETSDLISSVVNGLERKPSISLDTSSGKDAADKYPDIRIIATEGDVLFILLRTSALFNPAKAASTKMASNVLLRINLNPSSAVFAVVTAYSALALPLSAFVIDLRMISSPSIASILMVRGISGHAGNSIIIDAAVPGSELE